MLLPRRLIMWAVARTLANGIVRAIGEPALRFAEDKLRMLRGVRFAARLEFEIEPRTMAAIRAAAPEIGQVSSRAHSR